MSPSVGNFVHDLVEMAKAMEELPLVRDELSRTNAALEQARDTIAAREGSILTLKDRVEELQARVRDAEANRDDAELRFLEADDHIAAFRRLVSAFSTDTVALLKAIDPPKAEPTPEPVPPLSSGETGPIASSQDPQEVGSSFEAKSEPIADVRHDYDPVPSLEGTPMPQPTPQPNIIAGGGTGEIAGQVTSLTSQEPTEGVSVQSDPSSPASLTTTSTPTTASSNDADTPASALDGDVGYHNEPVKYSVEWYQWASRMDHKYGPNYWPNRP